MSHFKEEMAADECIYRNMAEYSAYTITSKFPNTIDGLKPIHRRILVSMHRNPGKAKESTVAGRVMEMHPHGDASISDAISGLAQPFTNIIPLVESQSNLGTYVGDDPAAARYVDVYHAESAEDLFFKNTDFSCLKMIPCESEKGVEPANFVPVIPTTFIFPVLGIGCGFKTETSAISIKNTCIAARKFIEMKYSDPDNYKKKLSSLAQYLLPDFPSYCHLRNARQIVSEYRKGNFDCPFVIDGIMTISKDTITLTTLPPDRSFGKVTQDVGSKTIRDKTSWLHDNFQDMKDLIGKKSNTGSTKGNYVCFLRRGVNPFEVLTMFKKIVQFTSIWKPTRLYNDDEKGLSAETPLTLLDKWSEARYKVVLGGLKQKQIDLSEQYRKLDALSIVVEHAKEVCEIFQNAKHEDDTIAILSKRFGLTPFQSKYLQTLPLKRLTAKGKEELLKEMEEIRKKNKELQSKFLHIPDEMVGNVTAFETKYADKYPAKCTTPEYIGTACYKGTGWIMIESLKECEDILARFDSEDLKFSLFQNKGQVVVIGSDDPDYDPSYDVPKYLHASYVDRMESHPKNLAIFVKGGSVFAPIPGSVGLIDGCPVPVCEKCTIITKSEGRQIITLDKRNVRASLNVTTPTIKDAYGASHITDDEVIIAHCNSKVPGVINIERIRGNQKIARVVIGETKIIGIYRIGQPVLMSLPVDVCNRTPIKHMYIQDLSEFVKEGQPLKLLLTRKKTSTGLDLTPYKNRSQFYTIKSK